MFSNVINKMFPDTFKSKKETKYPIYEGGALIVSAKEYGITLEKDDDGVEYYTTVINNNRFKFKVSPHAGKEGLESWDFHIPHDPNDEQIRDICVEGVKRELRAEIFLEENLLFKEYLRIFDRA